MNIVAKIDKNIYSCISDNIVYNEVIITKERIKHIKSRHPDDYEQFNEYFTDIIENPDYIIESNKPNTATILKEIAISNDNFKLILKLSTPQDNPYYKNSIITFMKISKKEWNRLLKNKKILYKHE